MTTNLEDKKTNPYVPNPYDERGKSLNVSLSLNQWREQNRLHDSKTMLIVHEGPCREEFMRMATKVNGQARSSDITLLPVMFAIKHLFRTGSIQVYLDEVHIWEDSRTITFSGRMNSAVHQMSLVEVRGEYSEEKKRGVVHCFG
ncbi:MAG TPA: hypothetical protein PLB38_03275 [bacterium]|nr:hypothetical protein [bacterium]